MSNSGYTTPDQPIRSRTPVTPRHRSLRATEEDFSDFDALVARNLVPVLAVAPWTPVRQNSIRLDTLPPAAPRRIVRAGPRRVMMATPPGDEPMPMTPVPVTPVAVPRRRVRSPRSSSVEPIIKRPRFEE